MIQHYFIGIQVPKKEALIIDQMRSKMKLHNTHKILPVPEDMHITLLYLGAVEKEIVFQLIKSIELIAHEYKIFQLTSNEVLFFGNPVKPRVVYANIEENELLIHLHRKLRSIIKSLGISVDEKAFVPHITLAKKWRNSNEEICAMSSFEIPIKFEVNQFSIYEIHPNLSPKYKPIATFRLGDA
jgi:2'-5' RNA ligase